MLPLTTQLPAGQRASRLLHFFKSWMIENSFPLLYWCSFNRLKCRKIITTGIMDTVYAWHFIYIPLSTYSITNDYYKKKSLWDLQVLPTSLTLSKNSQSEANPSVTLFVKFNTKIHIRIKLSDIQRVVISLCAISNFYHTLSCLDE